MPTLRNFSTTNDQKDKEVDGSSEYDHQGFADKDEIQVDFRDDAEEIDYSAQGYGWNAQDKWTKMLLDQELDKDGKQKPQVTTYHKKRNPFYKLQYNENHIPNQQKYARIRLNKPKLPQWDNPAFDWPPKLPRPTMHKGKALIL